MINVLEKMVREGGMLEKRLTMVYPWGVASQGPLAEMRKALSDAYDACEDAYSRCNGRITRNSEEE